MTVSNQNCIHKTIILPVVLYGCKTLSLVLIEPTTHTHTHTHTLRVFEKRTLRRIFCHKREGRRGSMLDKIA
jgi:hypothetical protein